MDSHFVTHPYTKQNDNVSAELANLRSETEFLSELLSSAYLNYLFLRPIIADKALSTRMKVENKVVGFNRIGETLYWAFVQQLVKIWDDRDRQGRTVSIRKVLDELVRYKIVSELEEIHCRWTWPHGELPDAEILKQIRNQEEAELRDDFRVRFPALVQSGQQMLSSEKLTAYRKVRNRLIAHTETKRSDGKVQRFDIRDLQLKFGEERQLLAATIEMVHEMQSLIQGVDFDWSSLRSLYTKDVFAFWEIDSLDENCP
jgi:hypothetical protein